MILIIATSDHGPHGFIWDNISTKIADYAHTDKNFLILTSGSNSLLNRLKFFLQIWKKTLPVDHKYDGKY